MSAMFIRTGIDVLSFRNGKRSMQALYGMGALAMSYSIVKLGQLGGIASHCGSIKIASILAFYGTHILQYTFYTLRYVEVHTCSRWHLLVPAIMLIVTYSSSIPISIYLDQQVFNPTGACIVKRSPTSFLFAMSTDFILESYLLILFTVPIFKTASNFGDKRMISLGISLVITNGISMAATVFYNISLATQLSSFGPMFSSLDLAINYSFSCLPYFLSQAGSSGSGSNGGSGAGGAASPHSGNNIDNINVRASATTVGNSTGRLSGATVYGSQRSLNLQATTPAGEVNGKGDIV
ncbi:hypothetical protein HDU76_014097 [Blyttiomyces sp. JEL0837]|nr:hypothetical protein HDU76_014097 [Blyttiomyces sp. JEL0837]